MSTALTTLTSKLATRLDMGDGNGLIDTLKATAFKGQVSDAQMTALMIVANQYGLNPWTKEIYAFPDKNNGIVPVVGVDGWARIINSHSQFDGMDFEQTPDSCTCTIYRKDRSHPTKVTEWMAECKRTNVGPWVSHPYRMLRHKAMIQAARLAFGFVGIYEQDEADRIIDAVDMTTGELTAPAKPRRASEVAQAALPTPSEPDLVIVPQVSQVTAHEAVPVSQVTPPPAAQVSQVTQTGEPASAGECMNIIKTCNAKKINLSGLLGELGLDLDPATLSGMTKDTFKALKARML